MLATSLSRFGHTSCVDNFLLANAAGGEWIEEDGLGRMDFTLDLSIAVVVSRLFYI